MNTTRSNTFLNDEDISAATYTLVKRVEASANTVIDTLTVWIQRYRERRALLELSDQVLEDIGLNRADVYKELNKPFWRA